MCDRSPGDCRVHGCGKAGIQGESRSKTWPGRKGKSFSASFWPRRWCGLRSRHLFSWSPIKTWWFFPASRPKLQSSRLRRFCPSFPWSGATAAGARFRRPRWRLRILFSCWLIFPPRTAFPATPACCIHLQVHFPGGLKSRPSQRKIRFRYVSRRPTGPPGSTPWLYKGKTQNSTGGTPVDLARYQFTLNPHD